MFRRDLSARKQRRTANLQRRRRLVTESLEDRRLLFAPPIGGLNDHVFAFASGNIGTPGGTVVETLDTSGYTTPRNLVVLGFQVKADGASTLDPAAVMLSGLAVQSVVTVPDVGTGNSSLKLARVFGSGNLDVTISGDGGTTGDFTIEVFLAGDEDGNRNVGLADRSQIRTDLGASSGDANYEDEADANLSGTITAFDYAQAVINNGVTVVEPSTNAAPMITSDGGGATAAVNVPENTTAVTDVQTSDDTDTEGSGLTYSKSGGVDAAKFNLDTSTGVLTFVTAPDFEVPGDFDADNDYIVIVTVTDSGGKFDSQELTVTVTDDPENDPPVITSNGGGATANVNVPENTTAVTDVDATDDNDSEGSGLTYSKSGPDAGAFTLNAATGLLTFTAAPDFETPTDVGGTAGDNIYLVTVTVTDSGPGAPLNDSQDLSVTVTDVVEVTPPVAQDDTFASLGNVGIVDGAGALFADNGNGADDDGGGTLTVSAVQGSGANVGNNVALTNGTVNVAANGSFTYTPNAGFTGGADTFTYDITNGGGTDQGAVTINVSDMIWFIDATAGGTGDGTLADPFDQISDLTGVDPDDVNHTIFMYAGSYTGPFTLENGQELVGEGATASLAVIAGLTVPSNSAPLPTTGGTAPVISSSANGIDLASGNTVRGLDIGNTTGVGLSGSSVGTSTVSDVSITGTGQGVNITSGTLAFSFDEVSSSNAAGITLNAVGGDFDVATGTISSGSATAINIIGSPLDLGITLTSVSSTGAANGININNTTGSFTITGTGVADSGGVISTTAGDNDETNTIGDGIALTNASNIDLSWMRIEDAGDHGININGVTNFQLKNSVLNDDHTHSVADDDEQGILIKNLYGQSLIQDVSFNAINEDGIEVVSDAADDATRDELTLRRVTFQNHQGANGEHGLDYQPIGTSNTRLLIDDSDFLIDGDGAIGALLSPRGFANAEIIVRNSDFDGTTAFGSGGVEARSSANATVKYLIETSRFNENNFFPLAVLSDGDSTMDATVRNNTFANTTAPDGTSGGTKAIDTAIFVRQDEDGLARVLIDNNNITGSTEFRVIEAQSQDSIDGNSATGRLDITITNNSFVFPGDLDDFATGIFLNSGVFGSGHDNVLRADVRGNSGVTGGGFQFFPGFGEATGLQEVAGSVLQLEQGTSAVALGAQTSAVLTVLDNNNPGLSVNGSTGGIDEFVTGDGNGTTYATIEIIANGTVVTPTLPSDPTLLVAAGGVGPGAASVCYAHVGDVVAAAISRLAELGLSDDAQATLDSVEVVLTNLSSGALGQVVGNQVLIDDDAAGWGWFVDATPEDDSEFGSGLVADASSPAFGQMDLLTAVMHELSHVLGVQHSDDPGSLMSESLETGTRRLADVDDYFALLS